MADVTDLADFADRNEVYAEFLPDDPPARITLLVKGLALGACIEIECIASRPSQISPAPSTKT